MARQFSRGGSRPRRRWFGIALAGTGIGLTQQVLNVLAGVAGTVTPFTVMRAMGDFLVSAVPDAAGDRGVLGLGIIVVQQAAASAGGASVPGPINDIDANWLWHVFVGLDAVVATAGSANDRALVYRVRFDVKSMRKVALDQDIILVAEMDSSSFATVDVTGGYRVLVQS